jgi:hypothetical protein
MVSLRKMRPVERWGLMTESYYFASQQHWLVRLILLFCRTEIATLGNGWRGKYKRLWGNRYFITLVRFSDPTMGRDIPERVIPERP